MHAYHFNIGNSTDGGVGCAADIVALNRNAAVARLRMLLPDMVHIHAVAPLHPTEYINVYFNARAISSEDIDDVREVREDTTRTLLDEAVMPTEVRNAITDCITGGVRSTMEDPHAELEQLRAARQMSDTLLINAAPSQHLHGLDFLQWHVNRAKVLGNDPVTTVLGLMETCASGSKVYAHALEWLASRARGEAEL